MFTLWLADITELNLPKSCYISFPDGKDSLMNFEVTIKPGEGYYKVANLCSHFKFHLSILMSRLKVYHPNIDLEGNVCLNILREDWTPIPNINIIIYGLFNLFTQPNHEDPLNSDAANVLRDDPDEFKSNVKRAMSGGSVGDVHFSSCLT
ncbi:probable NEDD8-conjugating enzyme Ubc12-like [Populus nigra]|uniref:probable NEDD8-conjugating enzyme Ubc12-like n=1 Tax=Populus nigra TaxID=3691 RepID=UPI002B264B9F|nr:probable NEDD8-conjugating enzyme Ubc12-like [Populus nigra]